MWNEPLKSFGVLHILSIVIALAMMAVGAILGSKYKYAKNPKLTTKILAILGLVFLALELFKQIFNALTIGWNWSMIPFQICSMILYILLAFPFVKNEKVRRFLVCFIAYISLVAATFYFVKPAAALNATYVIMTFHSLIWHWLCIGVGTFCITSFDLDKKEEWKTCLGSVGVFSILTLIAVALDFLFNALNISVNYFYLNINEKTFYPLLNLIFKPDPKPYVIFILVFIIYFSIGAAIFYGIAMLIRKLRERKITK